MPGNRRTMRRKIGGGSSYVILSAFKEAELSTQVNDYLKAGYSLAGGVTIANAGGMTFYQALFKQ